MLLPEESKYISDVLQRLIDIPMERKIKLDSTMYGFPNQTMAIAQDQVVITPPDTNHPNWPKTVEAIKYIIDCGMDKIHGFEITLNNSKTKFRKSIYVKPKIA